MSTSSDRKQFVGKNKQQEYDNWLSACRTLLRLVLLLHKVMQGKTSSKAFLKTVNLFSLSVCGIGFSLAKSCPNFSSSLNLFFFYMLWQFWQLWQFLCLFIFINNRIKCMFIFFRKKQVKIEYKVKIKVPFHHYSVLHYRHY